MSETQILQLFLKNNFVNLDTTFYFYVYKTRPKNKMVAQK